MFFGDLSNYHLTPNTYLNLSTLTDKTFCLLFEFTTEEKKMYSVFSY